MDTNNSVSWADLRDLTPEHAQYLAEKAAITPAVALASGIRSARLTADLPEHAQSWGSEALPAIIFPYRRLDGTVVEQVKPDEPIFYKDEARPRKYLLAEGSGSILNAVRPDPTATTLLLVEGTKQTFAAASHAGDSVAVFGIAGCRNWSKDGVPVKDLRVVKGKHVVIALDADVETNLSVYEAGQRLEKALKAEQPASIKFMLLPGGKTTGLDDLLADREDDEHRRDYLAGLIGAAGPLPKRKPAAKREAKPIALGDDFFEEGGLLVKKLSEAILERTPGAVTAEERIALYRPERGFYNIDKVALIGQCSALLGDRFRTGHCSNVEMFLLGELANAGMFLPTYVTEALLNVPNGMLDLVTATLKPHDPIYFSTQQIMVDWNPEATCPTYDQWVRSCGIADQIDDLEETASTMLDPSQTPPKAVFLFGPSRSGKSTFLRLMQAMVGQRNMSAVTLHQLSENRFAAANVFGKMLNCAADLSAAHVEDISIFKMMSGDDPIQADRKFGAQFAFNNRALFAFSANELPTVGEGSRAYVERIKPFEFGHSFAGHEDPEIEKAMMRELPGILVRWVRAWQRRHARGTYMPTDARVLAEFETRSDRVRQFVSERCVIHLTTVDGQPVTHGTTVDEHRGMTKVELVSAFNEWAAENSTSKMGRNKIVDRVMQLPNVVEVRRLPNKTRALNITVRNDGDSVWTDDEGPKDPSGNSETPSGSFAPQSCHSATEVATRDAQVSDSGAVGVAEVATSRPPVAHPSRKFLAMVTESRGVEGGGKEEKLGVGTGGLEVATSATRWVRHPDLDRAEAAIAAAGEVQLDLLGDHTAQSPKPITPEGPVVPNLRRADSPAGVLAPNEARTGGSPLSALLPAEDKQMTCPHCRGRKQLVPPSNFWYACPTCFADTFGA
jgi:putative DNA primase/helicase